ncbi:hypothetical protein ACQUSR_24985 [Streptomyces sp. P1-3]|uniref:hypothetical protein n=1 Tax=Streptomyces sp. P1-3 TaxID=3421658 RepID=UPI003D364166
MAVVGALGATAFPGCGRVPVDEDHGEIQRMLDRRAAAVRERDAGAFLATVDRGAVRYRSGQRRVFENLADVPLGSWTYRLAGTGGFTPVAGTGRRIAARVELRYRLVGYDTAPVTSEQFLTLVRRDGRWYVASAGGKRGPQQLWDQGDVEVVRGRHSLVLGVGQDRARLREIAATADRAVPAVSAVWREKWAHRVVIQVPASVERLAGLLGTSASAYRGIAAVTTAELVRKGSAPADRVIVNPDAYAVLGAFGRQAVMTHETAHVATRASTTESTPLWLSEGFADWVGYRGADRRPQALAPELTTAVLAGRPPHDLPDTDAFRFGTDGPALARAYEEGWLACRMIAERWGERKLAEFYGAVGAGAGGERRSVDAALKKVLGVERAEFMAGWRSYVKRTLG